MEQRHYLSLARKHNETELATRITNANRFLIRLTNMKALANTWRNEGSDSKQDPKQGCIACCVYNAQTAFRKGHDIVVFLVH